MSSSESFEDKDEIISEQNKKIRKLGNDIKKLKSDINEKDELIDEHNVTIEKLKRDNKKLKQSRDDDTDSDRDLVVNEKIVNLEQKLKEREEEIEKLIYNVKETENAIVDIQKTNGEMEQRIQELSSENIDLVERIEKQQDETDSSSFLTQQINDQSLEITIKDKKIQELTDTIERLNDDMTSTKEIVRDLRQQVGDKRSGLKNNDDKDDEINDLKKKIKKMEKMLRKCEQDSEMVNEYQEGLSQLTDLTNCKIKTMADCVRIIEQKVKVQKSSKNVDSLDDRSHSSLNDQTDDIDDLNRRIKDLVKKSKKKEQEFKKKLLASQEEIDELQETIDDMNRKAKKLIDRKKVQELEERIEELEEEIDSKCDDLKKREKKMKELVDDMEELRSEKDQTKTKELASLIDSKKSYEQELKALRENMSNLVTDNKKTIELLKNDKDETMQLLKATKINVQKKQEEIDSMTIKIDNLKTSEGKLRLELADKAKKVEKFQEDKYVPRDQYDQLTQLYNNHKKRVDELEEQLQDKDKEMNLWRIDANRQDKGDASPRLRPQDKNKKNPAWWKNHQEPPQI